MRLEKLHIKTRFKNLYNFVIDFSIKEGITVLIGNNGSGKSNILEAISSIFAGLYSPKFKPTFEYELRYTKDNHHVLIIFENGTYTIKVNDVLDNLKREYLPTQVISSYSGEETRLWGGYYEPFYKEYIKALRGASFPSQDLIYINRYYWNIALLTFHFYDFEAFTDIRDFCQKILGIEKLNHVTFTFNKIKLKSWESNPVVNFVKAINPAEEDSIQITLDILKERLRYLTNERDFFKYLAAAFMPKDDKLITSIHLDINNNINSDCLSEGEKKLMLIKLILEVVGDENSLILLDEPDSHIHISRKENIQRLLKQYDTRENVITTHSPTLTHVFENKHITMLTKDANNDVQIEAKEKQEIVYELTKGIWSYQEQNIFLNSNNDILLVEGKSDETFLKKALDVLNQTEQQYANLNFEYLPCGGAEGVKLMTKKFKPKVGQHIIALFDSDQAGWEAINKVFERDKSNKYDSSNFGSPRIKEDIWIAVYPSRPYYRGGSNFNIEDYFSKSILNKYVLQNFKGLDTLITKNMFKKTLEDNCENFPSSEFKHFKVVFDLILKIKAK
jgi:ABC-type cobalamin/Fe3+-siderophores transport system ATPase subunit